MKALRLPLLSAITLTASLGGAALAQTAPSSEQAKALEKQIHDALTDATGGVFPIPPRPVEMIPEGDHYLVRVPLAEIARVEPPDAAFTAQARMLDATRWSIDNQKLPSNFKITTVMSVPDAPDAKTPGPDGKHNETVTYTVKLGQQEGHGIFDPAYATVTTSTGSIATVDILRAGGSAAGVTHMSRVSTQTSLRPIDPAHIDMLSDTTTDTYATESSLPDGTAVKFSAASTHVIGGLSGVAHDKLLPLLHQAVAVSKLKTPPPGDKKAQAAFDSALRQLITLSKGLLTGGRIEEAINEVKFDVSGHTGSFGKLAFAFSGDAPQDMLTTTMGFTLDGLVVDELPPAMASYVPTHFSIRPTVSNISLSDITKMGMDAANTPAGAPPGAPAPDTKALFSHGGINIGFDSLGLDIAGAQFSGSGKFTMTGPQTVNGQAEITAHGLDALITKAQADPMLAQGVPVIIFLKGIAHTTGDQAVWQISASNQKVLVNGVDLSAMMGAMK
jgi:hypothetical protein